jgi:hypothetical protein
MSEEIVEQKISEETAELESAAEWKDKATGGKNNMGDQDDLPFDVHKEEEMQLSRLQRRSQPIDQLDRRLKILGG